MEYTKLRPRKALNKAFLKVKPSRIDIERFKVNMMGLLDGINESESEEFHKNLFTDFLKKTYYDEKHFINTKGRNDLVIHIGKDARTSVGVIIETKNPTNKNEILRIDNINTKALQELLLYYLRERITNKNLEIRHLIATNFHEWFIFDAQVFEKLFAQNKELVGLFQDFEEGRLGGTKTDYFYKEVAARFIKSAGNDLCFTHINLLEYRGSLRGTQKGKDARLIPLFKVFSPEHLLKLPFSNDSNTLDRRFYSELLHIIGLTERKEKGKKLIERKQEGDRNAGSLIENAVVQLDSLDKVSRLENPQQFGGSHEERIFSVALELAITWINRVLFLKLLEAQLISYHKGDRSYAFLNSGKVGNYDGLNSLFFQVLARTSAERSDEMQELFSKVPYLNSSLFEPTGIEHDCLFISQIEDQSLPIHSSTVLKNANGKKRTGEMDALEYLFEFLDAYDFTSEGAEDIQEDNKALINASVLGLIFEKINGYKDGSFFTPGFITMYMCRDSIRRTVLQKFNENKSWDCETIDQLYDRIDDKAEANEIINSLKICDPAVGSGHFLVSALNEIITLKSDLKILLDRDGKTLRDYQIEIVNDELIVIDDDGGLFEYNPKSSESQRIQETLFHEKQTIIENCLFGVDINPNSVKICRLRLWIELLKNAYYKNESELETLPNIDINIKRGNSLISRYDLDTDLKQALKKSKGSIDDYRSAVMSYRNAQSKDEKRAMETLIHDIKSNFEAEIYSNDKRIVKLKKLRGESFTLTNQIEMFELSKREKAARNKSIKKLTVEITKLDAEIEEIKNNRIYEEAFEWRFEFPEVLDDNGDFIGFDCIIGNPPFIRQEEFKEIKPYLKQSYETFTGTADLYVYFVELGMRCLRKGGTFNFITPNKWMRVAYGKLLRNFIKEHQLNSILDFGDLPVFEEATAYPCILSIDKSAPKMAFKSANITTLNYLEGLPAYIEETKMKLPCENLLEEGWQLENPKVFAFMQKLQAAGTPLSEYVEGRFYRGITTGCNEAFVIDGETRSRLISEDTKSAEIIKPYLRGRDVKRWYSSSADLWLIFPRRGIAINSYPAVKKYLSVYENRLMPGVKGGRKAGSYEWYEIQDNIAYWQEFQKPKIVSTKISIRPTFALDLEGCYLGNTSYLCPVSTESGNYILGLLNSILFFAYAKKVFVEKQNGWFEVQPEKLGLFPIPSATLAQQSEIVARVEKILTLKLDNPDADVSELEAEINQLVYKLYDLTPDEIAIVEASVPIPKKTKPLLTDKVLPELKQLGSYFSYDAVKAHLAKIAGAKVPASTLKTYLSKFVEDGVLFDAGKGWYSNLPDRLELNSESVQKIAQLLSEQFPLLEVSCWSTEQINPFMHHLLSRFVTFVYTDADALETVGDALSDAGHNVLVNPGKSDIEKFYGKTEQPVILRAAGSKEPAAVSGIAPPEKLLVDLLLENNKFFIMEPAEAENVLHAAIRSGRVNFAALLSYAKRKRVLLDPKNINQVQII